MAEHYLGWVASNHASRLCINRQVLSSFNLLERYSSHLQSMNCHSLHVACSAFPLSKLIWLVVLYTTLRSFTTISIGSIPASTQTASTFSVSCLMAGYYVRVITVYLLQIRQFAWALCECTCTLIWRCIVWVHVCIHMMSSKCIRS